MRTQSFFALLLLAALDAPLPAAPSRWTLWYDRPAEGWTEALPVGNGHLGAMVFGGVADERIQFNEDTLWVGGPHDYTHPGAAEVLPELRRLLFDGKQAEAERLAMERFMSLPLGQMPYQPTGDLHIQRAAAAPATDYRRELDLDAAVATTSWREGETRYTQRVLASYPARAIVVHLEADRPGSVNFEAALSSPQADVTTEVRGDTLILRGRARDFEAGRSGGVVPGQVRFEVRMRACVEGGQAVGTDKALEVRGADAATLVVVAATSYVNAGDVSADPAARCDAMLALSAEKPFAKLLEEHQDDHRALFRRIAMDLGGGQSAELPTDRRVLACQDQRDPDLEALVFQYGRYLLIASSRPGSQPATLQGIWNESLAPPWDSKYTCNINTEMNYWPAEVTNLAECHEPLFAALDELVASGRRTAQVHYGCRGWVLHHNFDLWRGTAPINHSNHGIWPTGGAWLCQHLWWHYLYGGDREFLAQRAYPVMKEASLFFVDYLVEDPVYGKGWLVSGPSNSPERGGLVMAPAMDHQIIRSLFASTAEAARILGVDDDLRRQLLEMHGRVAPDKIGEFGQIQEWLYRDDPKTDHRHVSHLWALFPGEAITPDTPDLFAAAKQSLLMRGDGGTGWSMAWKVNFWARMLDGDHARLMLGNLLRLTDSPLTKYRGGGVYPNLFDAHPPFQIDGNFGATSGIAEMLLQSHRRAADGSYAIDLLPALPSAWPDGQVEGLCARGGVEVALAWQGGTLQRATLRSARGGTFTVRAGGKTASITLTAGEPQEWK